MNHLKSFNEANGESFDIILRRLAIRNYTITHDGKVDVSQSVHLGHVTEYDLKPLKKLPIKFGRVEGDFTCPPDLTTLVGCPDYVSGIFDCSGTKIKNLNGSPTYAGDFDCRSTSIKNLKGGPTQVGRHYNCGFTSLQSFEGSPRIIPEDFWCSDSDITNLFGSPDHVGGVFDVGGNKYLTSLEGGPTSCGTFHISKNPKLTNLRGMPQKVESVEILATGITSLEGSPDEIDYNFVLQENYALEDFIGGPRVVTNVFQCSDSDLTSLEGMPTFCGHFRILFLTSLVDPTALRNCQVEMMDFHFTPIYPIAKLFKTNKDFKDSLDYGYFVRRDGEVKILRWKFEEALSEFGIEFPTDSLKYEFI